MAGIMYKRLGDDVTILERFPDSNRGGHAAGLGLSGFINSFLKEYDLTNYEIFVGTASTWLTNKDGKTYLNLKVPRGQTSWGLLYHVLRANFDGYPSPAVPKPPMGLETDGQAIFEQGKKVTDLKYMDGVVTVYYDDLINGGSGSIDADIVIGADGHNSTVGRLLNVPDTTEYSGYVAWRGNISESKLSEASRKYFDNRLPMCFMDRTYILA
jgi:2-polyprenyl-6-methoxyphenol hydroxylase-like FAD-dependent oxidoreductase